MEEIKNKTNLASNQENGKKEHGVFALVAVAVVLLFFGSFAWISINKLNKNTNSRPQPSADRDYCRQDSDCVLASKYYISEYGQSSCCPMNCEQEAVNIETKTKEAAERDKLCATKDYQCPVSEQCAKQSLKEAVCEQSRCVAKVTPVVSNIDLNCEDLQKEITKDLDNLNYCQTKEDCAVMKKAVGCPFGCWNFVSKRYADDESLFIQSKIDDFFNKCPLSPICEMCVPIPPNIDFSCVNSKCVEAVGADNTSSNTAESNNVPQHKDIDWDLPIDLQRCDITERRTFLWGLGSKSVTTKDHKSNVCVLEYTNEIEGGYTTSECSIPDSLGTVLASQLPLLEYCKETKSGNMLLGN